MNKTSTFKIIENESEKSGTRGCKGGKGKQIGIRKKSKIDGKRVGMYENARRSAYDAKEKGAPDRSLQQLKENYNPDNY